MASWERAAVTVSVSIRSTGVPGKSVSSSSWTFWVPTPMKFSFPPQSGQAGGRGWE